MQTFDELDLSQTKTIRDATVEKIREAIVSGQLKPGQHLKERELSKWFQISTTPIKEAFRILGHEGLLVTIPRKGTYVSEMANSSIEEVIMLRARVEGLASRLAAEKWQEDKSEKLQAQLARMKQCLEDEDDQGLAENNRKFHRTILELAENPLIMQVHKIIDSFDQAFRKRALRQQKLREKGLEEHMGICQAIMNKDGEEAEKRMEAHILGTLKDVMERDSD